MELLDDVEQRAAPDLLHGEVGAPIGQATGVVDRHDPRVLELAGGLGLLDEPQHQIVSLCEIATQHLHRDRPVEGQIPDPADLPHPALLDQAHVFVAIDVDRWIDPGPDLGIEGQLGELGLVGDQPGLDLRVDEIARLHAVEYPLQLAASDVW